MYEEISVFQAFGNRRLKRYRCFKSLETGCFSVLAADFLDAPVSKEAVERVDVVYYNELFDFLNNGPEKEFESIEEAIAWFDQ